jgi:hypothetical protein
MENVKSYLNFNESNSSINIIEFLDTIRELENAAFNKGVSQANMKNLEYSTNEFNLEQDQFNLHSNNLEEAKIKVISRDLGNAFIKLPK